MKRNRIRGKTSAGNTQREKKTALQSALALALRSRPLCITSPLFSRTVRTSACSSGRSRSGLKSCYAFASWILRCRRSAGATADGFGRFHGGVAGPPGRSVVEVPGIGDWITCREYFFLSGNSASDAQEAYWVKAAISERRGGSVAAWTLGNQRTLP